MKMLNSNTSMCIVHKRIEGRTGWQLDIEKLHAPVVLPLPMFNQLMIAMRLHLV